MDLLNFEHLKVNDREKEEFYRELDSFYGSALTGGTEKLDELLSLTDKYSDPCKKREVSYGFLARELDIKVFAKCPFAFHYDNRLCRADVESSGISYWYSNSPKGQSVLSQFYQNIQNNFESGLAIYYLPVDNGHLTINYDTVLKKGLRGIAERIAERKELADEQKKSFYCAMESGLNAYICLAHRFAEKAAEEAKCHYGKDKERLLMMAEALKKVPEHPASNFYEAISAMVFMYYAVPALDGGNVSVLGHVDRLLGDLLDADLKNQSITVEQAFDIIWRFLYIPDARWGRDHKGTNCTVTLGGCDGDGNAVFNTVTQLIIHGYIRLGCMDPKLNIRIAPNSPQELIRLSARAISNGGNNACIFNDEVIITANQKAGKALRDARLYVAGGCQENVLAGCEQNSRATIYMNSLPALFGLWDDSWNYFTDAFCNKKPERYVSGDGFEQIYQKTLRNLRLHVEAQVNMKNISEARGRDWCLSPAHSALLDDCIERGRDMYCGGARYSSGSVSLVGIATLIDSLLAIKWAVFDQKLIDFESFIAVIKDNFACDPDLRRNILAHAPKFARDDEADLFAARLLRDAAALSRGLKNTRGGSYEPSLFSFRSFTALGCNFPATPDGRLKGEYLSASASPSLLSEAQATAVINALKHLDLTDYPVVAITDVKLPRTNECAIEALIRVFLKNRGSVLQCNTVDQDELLDAKAHPERHADLVVRISGFSARFVALCEQEQDEVIARTCG